MHDEEKHNAFLYESSVRFDANRIRAAAVYCSDGRFGEQFDDLLHNALQLPRYDRLAVPGGAACLAGHFTTYREDEGVFAQLRFLVNVHGLERVVLIAHENCAFYSERLRVSPLQLETEQREDIRKAVRKVRSLSRTLSVNAFFARKHRKDVIRFESVEL
ncbi:MAG: carbonic anhydrase [Fuerstiella sp.]